MKAAIYDPYLDTMGGGERYCLTVAEILLKNGWQVDLFWSGQKDILKIAQQRFSLEIKDINIVPDIFQLKAKKINPLEGRSQIKKLINRPDIPLLSPFQKIRKFIKNFQITKSYHLFFYLSDGSTPTLFAKNNFLHIQVPFNFTPTLKQTLLNPIKLKLANALVICNSHFTRSFATRLYHRPSVVLYPPVDVDKFKPSKFKKNHILSVGRFDNILNAKKQDVLIKAFATVSSKNPDWKLILAGGSTQAAHQNAYLHYLRQQALDLPVKFVVNPPFNKLKKLYSKAKIYWHATGFKVNQQTHPEATEHFGITVVEAMAAGLVPIVVKKGGLPEIITHSQNGFHWNGLNDLIDNTQILINQPKKIKQMRQSALQDCQKFSKHSFEKQLLTLIKK